jgi:Cytochrome P450
MLALVSIIAVIVVVASLPAWLPRAIIGLRMRIFTRINGSEGIAIPGPLIDASHFMQLYSHPAARGRSQGAALSDLFWYWLSPGPHVHQEHLEDGERYEEAARTTRRILALPKSEAEELTRRCVARVVVWPKVGHTALVRLRDWIMPIWANFFYEVVFREPCTPAACDLIVANASDVVTALKCTSLRHMATRGRLTQHLIAKLRNAELPHTLPERMSIEERALYLQGVFFNTAVVQSSEALAHVLMALAQHERVQAEVTERPEDDRCLARVIDETLRMYPLFGISHRITTADITLDEHATIPKGSVLCFNHLEYHRTGFTDADRFDPCRWRTLSPRDCTYIPYGVASNRPCPASGLAPIALRTAARELLARFAFYTSASHTRSIPNRGPCLVASRSGAVDPRRRRGILLFIRIRDRWEDVWRSIVQLILGTYMVWDARRLRLCERHFNTHDSP